MPDDASAPSSSSMSSPPVSPPPALGPDDTIRVARPGGVAGPEIANNVIGNPAQAALATQIKADTSASTPASSTNGTNPEKVKRPRKKKEVNPEDANKPKEKKPRKPREPKEKPAGATTGAPRAKKQKTEESKPQSEPPAAAAPRQPTIMDMVNSFQTVPPKSATPAANTDMSMPPRPLSSNANSGSINSALGIPPSSTPTPRPASRGYDPIRGFDPVRSVAQDAPQSRPASTSNLTPSAMQNRASASPSIASLIDPPAKTSTPTPSYSPQMHMQQPFVQSQPQSPAQSKPAPTTFAALPSQSSPPAAKSNLGLAGATDGAMDIDMTCEPVKAPSVKAQSKTSSPAPTPKAARPTPPPAPKGTGSGLLSSSSLFGGPSSSEGTERKGVNIDLRIKLNPQGGNTINIAQEIAKKYGRDAINPRAAAHRARLLEVAAAANKIENGDADEMSIDDMSDNDDSNVEMGGMGDDDATGAENQTAGENGASKPKRRKKVEEYDKEDDFIDDTELAWQEQAAVAKDGFFVYSGPLVPVGTDAKVESTSSAPTRGTRGRGRGRGRAAAAAAGATHASVAADRGGKDSTGAPATGRGRGRGRGTGTRRARATKADKMAAAAGAGHAHAATSNPAPTSTPPTLVPAGPATSTANTSGGGATNSASMSAPAPQAIAQILGTTTA